MRTPMLVAFLLIVFPMQALAASMADHIPDDVLTCVTWRGADALNAEYQGTHLQGIVKAANLGPVFSETIPNLIAKASENNPQAHDTAQTALQIAAILWKHPRDGRLNRRGGRRVANAGGPRVLGRSRGTRGAPWSSRGGASATAAAASVVPVVVSGGDALLAVSPMPPSKSPIGGGPASFPSVVTTVGAGASVPSPDDVPGLPLVPASKSTTTPPSSSSANRSPSPARAQAPTSASKARPPMPLPSRIRLFLSKFFAFSAAIESLNLAKLMPLQPRVRRR